MTDDELIAQAVAWARASADAYTRLNDFDLTGHADVVLSNHLKSNDALRAAVARHLLSRDPEAVRVPMKGTVS